MKRDSELLSADSCYDEFKSITEWSDTNITLFSQYVKWLETRDDNTNKKSMKITEAVDMAEIDNSKVSGAKKDRQLLVEARKKIEKIDLDKYLGAEDKSVLESMLNKLSDNIYLALLEHYRKLKTVYLVNYSVNKIKELADKKTDTVSRPSSTGFIEYAHARLALKKNTRKILDEIQKKPYFSDKSLGELEDKGQFYIRSMYRMLDDSVSKTDEFSVGIQGLKRIKKQIEDINTSYYSSEISTSISALIPLLEEFGVVSTNSFIGLSKLIVDNKGVPYEPSNGEKGILLLQQIIKEEADAYFFDEPELGMGNSYIDATIRPQISDLAKRHKIVVIATHNANLAVRTLPYMSIFRKYENGVYSTYVGNPFRNELENIYDSNDLLNWTFESMHTLEGGKEAFYERKDIYESGNT